MSGIRTMVEIAIAECLKGRPGDDLVAMCLRLPEGECNDALRAALNRRGVEQGRLARREASLGVPRTDITIQDMPSGIPLASIETKAITAPDALAAGFQAWVAPKIAGDVAKLQRQTVGDRFFVMWKSHWAWMSRPEMFTYPKLLRSTPRSHAERLSDEQLADEFGHSHAAVSQAMESAGLREVAVQIVAAGNHPDVGSVILTAHIAQL